MTALHRWPPMDALTLLTVVVPVGPGDTLEPVLRTQLALLPPGSELCVVCADASDAAAMEFAATAEPGPDWQCLLASPGRAAQQNAGAIAATREWLWFLHADSVLARETLPALAKFLQRNESALGYFDLRFLDGGPALMGLNALGTWMRSRWFGLPFGDQGLVLPRAAFERLRGFDTTLACGEDHDLVWRARRAGLPLRPVGARLYTSARKYSEFGWCSTTAATQQETWRQAWRFARREVPR